MDIGETLRDMSSMPHEPQGERFSVRPKQVHSMLTRDRVRLDADVYTPDTAGEFPVLLMRQPYGRAIASTVVYAHPIWYAAHGYIVVIQDVRGRGTSEGEFYLFEHEVTDGEDTIAWAAELPQSNGQVGMYGFSYQGMTQLYAAQANPANLKVIAPAMVGYNLYADWAYENGALLLQAGLSWAIQLAAETARRNGDTIAYEALFKASRQLPLSEPTSACPEVLKQYASDSFFHDWLSHPHWDNYWQSRLPDLSQVDLPMLHVGGWFDPYLRGDVRLFKDMSDRSQHLQHLWIGPWGHIPWGRRIGQRDFGDAANSPIDRLQICWFDHHLKQKDPQLAAAPAVCLFEMGRDGQNSAPGGHRWRQFDQWPQGNPSCYFLNSSGLANLDLIDGTLSQQSPAPADSPACPPDSLVHDPWRPAPSLGGHAAIPAGSFERSMLDCRSDVLTYTSESLANPLAIAGESQLEIYCAADAPSFDLCAILSEVHPDGRVFNLTQGYCRCSHDASTPSTHSTWGLAPPQRVTLPLHPTCFWIPQGHRLRLSLSAACFPAYAVNPGTATEPQHARTMDAQIITLAIYHDGDRPSHLILPVADHDGLGLGAPA